ncbi:ParB N-terminal domain-containing protein [Sphingomonas sp. PAMC 26621]|uniref:ParB N-terminal domain-containing protein n=1 Tax=Sphingomonas sp. PAMC 26621 TaxID=1112213 RepID=UPI0004746789|nr:ParB N-terminal domain-containing protein [Sphingomonas sp. PAMC 26621]
MDHDWKPQRLAVASVKELEALQMRDGPLRKVHVQALARAMTDGQDVPPIKVARIGRALCVVDGFHRLAAARSLSREAIEALVAPMDFKAAQVLARVVNVGHGAGLRPRDKAKAFASYIDAGGHLDANGNVKSSRAIRDELPGLYSHTQILARLRFHKVRPAYDLEEAEGSKWGRGGWGYPEDADHGDDGCGGDKAGHRNAGAVLSVAE